MDLTLNEVAELLNIKVETLRKWVEGGDLPSYQIGGDVRFNRREVEDWMMQRQSEENLPFPEWAAKGTLQYSLYRAVHKGGVLHDICGTRKDEVIRNSVQALADKMELDAEVLTDLLLDRENLQPTALGHGIALPHTRDFLLDSHYDAVTVVFLDKPVDYGALDGLPVHTLFFLFACDDKRHLNLLSKIAHFCSDPYHREFLRSRPIEADLFERIKQWESKVPVKN